MRLLSLIRNGKLYVSNSRLHDAGVTEFAIEKWRQRQVTSFIFEAGYQYHVYTTIPKQSRKKLPPKEVLIKEAKGEVADAKQTIETEEERQIAKRLQTAKDKRFANYIAIYRGAFSQETSVKYAEKHAVLLEVLNFNRQDPSRYNYKKLHRALNLVYPGLYTEGSFKIAIWKIKKEGLSKFVPHGNHGNTNARITEELHEWGVKALASIGKAYSVPHIQKEINKVCKEYGLHEVSESWVKQFLAKPEVQELVNESRYGSDFALKQRPYLILDHAWFADDQWQVDGWSVPFYHEGKGKWERLIVCVVMDAHSGAWLGYSFDLSENGVMIWQAIEQAVKATGRLPYEIVSDNHSFNKTQETRNIKEQLALMGVEWTVTSNPRHKAQLERSFQTFGNKYCKPKDGYIGEGIKSRRKTAHPSPELGELYLKSDHRPDREGVTSLMLDLIAQYNNEAEEDKQSRMQKYLASERPHARAVDEWQAAYLFFKQTEVKVTRYMVELRIRNQRYQYPFKNNELKQRWNNQKVLVRYDSDPSEIYLSEPGTERHITKLRQAVKVAGAKANQTDKDRHEIVKNAARLKSYKLHLDKQREAETKAVAEKYGHNVPIELLNPATVPKEVYKSAIDEVNRAAVEHELQLEPALIKQVKPVNERLRTPYGRAVKQLQEQPDRTRENPFKVAGTAKPVSLQDLEED